MVRNNCIKYAINSQSCNQNSQSSEFWEFLSIASLAFQKMREFSLLERIVAPTVIDFKTSEVICGVKRNQIAFANLNQSLFFPTTSSWQP